MVELDFNPQVGEQVKVFPHDYLFEIVDRHTNIAGELLLKLRRLQDGKIFENVPPIVVDYPADERVRREDVYKRQVLVFESVVVVDVDGADVAAQGGHGLGDAYGDVGMPEVQTDSDVGEVSHLENEEQMHRGGGLADEVLDEQTDAEGTGKSAEVLERGDGVLDAALRPTVVAFAEMEDKVAEMDLVGGFEGALDLVHGVDAAGLLGMQDVDAGSAGAAHLAVGIQGCVH